MAKSTSTAPHPEPVLLHTDSGSHPLVLRAATGFATRLRGLMLTRALDASEGLVITRCASVHCAFMRYAIDVIYLDKTGKVIKCVPQLKPWRASMARNALVCHTLELKAGSIARLAISPGARLEHPFWQAGRDPHTPDRPAIAQRGSAMVEFVVVGPIITLIGLAIIQYGMLFFAKNQINHASFMAARAGSSGNANLAAAQSAYAKALVPLYGGGQSAAELLASLGKVHADIAGHVQIELLNPTKESFADWNSSALQVKLDTKGKRVIPNGNQAFKTAGSGATSSQTIQDANLIKLRITHGYLPKVPIIANIYKSYLKLFDPKTDTFHTKLVDAGRIPVVTHITMQMQSDAIEGDTVSVPGPGNGGDPANPGNPPPGDGPPPQTPPGGQPPVDPGGPCLGPDCPDCQK